MLLLVIKCKYSKNIFHRKILITVLNYVKTKDYRLCASLSFFGYAQNDGLTVTVSVAEPRHYKRKSPAN